MPETCVEEGLDVARVVEHQARVAQLLREK